ncbi:GNAT family N-acetyltransferase [Robiginitalea aurantiaca]|uniref:GNAT family N-acetyltransferase n=1 Tax=Robiginitalea aurantiaca TaxID=3056915 RepID=A0ABT7WGZ9_9FLAO|nr:GNAT family N-acetyltransferase [Robiginitalea aurantiaca]MDM9632195.1 GNAT family N-acetyltransferase [Robiginitalea aurantiaca]
MKLDYDLIDNADKRQYEFHVGSERPRLEYIRAKDKIYLTHTEVPHTLSGMGIGSALIGAALRDIKRQGLTLIPLCPFVALYLKRNPEWKELVLKGINIA